MTTEVRWLGVVGTRQVNDTIRADIEQYLVQKIHDGYGIVSGGATGADHEAARIAVREGLAADRFRIYLPTALGIYCTALLERGQMGKCRPQDAKETTALLRQITVKSPGVIWDSTLFTVVNAESFHARNRQIIDLADELVAFRVDKSAGTTYSVDQARANGLTVKLFDY